MIGLTVLVAVKIAPTVTRKKRSRRKKNQEWMKKVKGSWKKTV